MTLFRLDSSIRTDGSVSREIADTLQRAYTDQHPHGAVVRRDLAVDPIAPEAWIFADVWGADVTVVDAELTLATVNPAMAGLIPLAEASRARAHERAGATGAAYARLLTPAA